MKTRKKTTEISELRGRLALLLYPPYEVRTGDTMD